MKMIMSGVERQRPSLALPTGRVRISMPHSVGTPKAWPVWPRRGTLPTWSLVPSRLADLRIAQGRLREASSLYEQGLQRAVDHGVPALRGAADMHAGISQILYERNDLDAALRHVQLSRDLGPAAGFPQNEYRWRVALARIRLAQGDLDGAVALLDEAERRYAGDFSPNVRPVSALRARAFLAEGRLGEALDWARERGLSATDDLELPARVRAHHPRPGASGPVHGRARR